MTTEETALERQIRSQPEELRRILTSSQVQTQVHATAQGLHRAHRIWLVGTGTSQHAAELGAAMLQEAGRAAQAVPAMHFVDWAPIVGPQDGVIVITHTAESAYALAARATAFSAGLGVVMITPTRRGLPRRDRDGRPGDVGDLHGELHRHAHRARDARAATRRPELLARHAHRPARGGGGRDRRPRHRRRPARRAGDRLRRRRARLRHRPGGRPEGARGRPRPGRGLRRGVPAPRLGRPAAAPATISSPSPRPTPGGSSPAIGEAARAAGAGRHRPARALAAAARCWRRSRSPCGCRCWPCGSRRRAPRIRTR